MIIANNSASFLNPNSASSGELRIIDGTTAFLGCKPGAVCKRAGYLTINTSGRIYAPQGGKTWQLMIRVMNTGYVDYEIPIIFNEILPQGETLFSSHMDIIVSSNLQSDAAPVIVTTHTSLGTKLYHAFGFISPNPDAVSVMSFMYRVLDSTQPIPEYTVSVQKVIAEYKENGVM